MSRNYWENHLFPQFLQTVNSCTLSSFTNFEIQNQLNYLTIRALNDFKFPKVSLAYAFDSAVNPLTEEAFGYYFISDIVAQPEFSVVLARMKQYWIEFQISQERLFANAYYDREIRLHSPGNTIDKLIKMYTTFKDAADKAEFDYGRISETGTPSLGEINE